MLQYSNRATHLPRVTEARGKCVARLDTLGLAKILKVFGKT